MFLGLTPNEQEPSYTLALSFVHQEDQERYEKKLSEVVENKTEYYLENRIVKTDGAVIPVISRGKCIVDENNNLIRMIGTVQDVSIQKQIETLNEKINIAEKSDQMKSLILSVFAHDLNNPASIQISF